MRSSASAPVATAIIIAEIGTDMTRFPTAGHLASWAKLPPGVKESPRRRKAAAPPCTATPTSPGSSAKPSPAWPGPTPSPASATGGSPAAAAARSLIVAVGRSILVITWHLLSDPDAHHADLGSDFYASRINPERRKRAHIHQLKPSATKSPSNPRLTSTR